MIHATTVFAQVAGRYGAEEGEVAREIMKAIEYAIATADQNTLALWADIPRKGAVPSAEKLVTYPACILAGEA